MGAILLESVEGLGDASFVAGAGEIWESLQSEKEEVGRNLLGEATLGPNNGGGSPESEPSDEYLREIGWRVREQLEARLRNINDAQDRLIDGAYGRCIECGNEIDTKRLTADPAACRCVACQRSLEGEYALNERSRQV